MQMIGGNGGNQFRQNVGNLNGYNAVQNVKNQVAQNPRVQKDGNQNQIRNGNLVAVRAEGNAAGQIELSLKGVTLKCSVSQADIEDFSRGVVFFVYLGAGYCFCNHELCKLFQLAYDVHKYRMIPRIAWGSNSHLHFPGGRPKLILALRFRLQRIKYTLIEQGGPKEDLCMIAFQPQGVSVWEGAEAIHLQAEETKLEYTRILDFIRIIIIFPCFCL
nr:hypothetical protein [Tanacetum cinerariifolium]